MNSCLACPRASRQVLGLEPAFPVDPHKPLKELGMDSLMTIELAKVLSSDVARPVAATMLFTHPTVSAMASFLLDELVPRVAVEASQESSIEGELEANPNSSNSERRP